MLDESTIHELNILAAEEPGLLAELIDAYLEQCPALITTLRDAVLSGDREALGSIAHGIKGASYNMGAASVAHLAAMLEYNAKQNDLETASLLLQQLEADYAKTVAILLSLRK